LASYFQKHDVHSAKSAMFAVQSTVTEKHINLLLHYNKFITSQQIDVAFYIIIILLAKIC